MTKSRRQKLCRTNFLVQQTHRRREREKGSVNGNMNEYEMYSEQGAQKAKRNETKSVRSDDALKSFLHENLSEDFGHAHTHTLTHIESHSLRTQVFNPFPETPKKNRDRVRKLKANGANARANKI